jgi:uncharacterized protein
MKKQFLLILVVLLTGCRDNAYKHIKDYIDSIKIVDAHEHVQTPNDSTGFYFFNTISYFPHDLISAGAPPFNDRLKGKFNVDSIWNQYGRYYNFSRATSYHEQFMNSLRILYGYKKPYLKKEDIQNLYDKMIRHNYRNYHEWFEMVYRKGNFETMLQDQYWNHFNTQIDTAYFNLVFNINSAVMLVGEAAENKKITSNQDLLKLMNQQVLVTKGLDDYTNLIDSVLGIFKRKGAVCIKNSLAYSRSLDFEDVDHTEAVKVFNKTSVLDDKEKKQLQDYVFHHIIQQCIKLDLPIQIHTGYLAGNNGHLDNGQPMKLLNILIKYPKAKFILFHGGYPWTGDYVALGKNFKNVYLDLVWLPQISKTEANHTLHEMLDAIPYNKFLWGGDVSRIEDAVGSLELGKEVVATVLAERVEKGEMTEGLAFEIAKRIFRDNAIELFRLDKKL